MEILYSKKYNKFSISNFLQNIVLIILLAIVLTVGVSYIFGYKLYIVRGTSSLPTIQLNSLIIVYKVPQEDIHKGDYISFRQGNAVVTHKVTNINPDGSYITASYNHIDENGNLIEGQTYETSTYDTNLIGKVLYPLNSLGKILWYMVDNIVVVALAIVCIVLANRFINYKFDNYVIIF